MSRTDYSSEETARVFSLARLELSEEEKESSEHRFQEMIRFTGVLQQFSLSKSQKSRNTELPCPLREDIPAVPSFDLSMNAPNFDGDYLRIPPVFPKEENK